MNDQDLDGFGPVGTNGKLFTFTTEQLAEDAFLKAERVRALMMMNTPADYGDRKRAFIELALAREADTKARLALEERISGPKP